MRGVIMKFFQLLKKAVPAATILSATAAVEVLELKRVEEQVKKLQAEYPDATFTAHRELCYLGSRPYLAWKVRREPEDTPVSSLK